MNIKLLVLSIAAVSLVGCGAYTAERSGFNDLPFPRLIDDQDYEKHFMGALDTHIIVSDASDVPFFRPIDDQDAVEHNVGTLGSNITVADVSDVPFFRPIDDQDAEEHNVGAVTFNIVTV